MQATSEAILALKTHIEENMESLNHVYDEWPNYQEDLNMPCAVLMTSGNVTFINKPPTLVKNEAGLSYYDVGEFEFSMTIDIWTEYKYTRGELLEELMNLFEQNDVNGLNLTLTEYYNAIASFSLSGYNYLDNEEGSQRDEWRCKINLIVNVCKVKTKVESLMTEITLESEISEFDTIEKEIKTIN